VQLLDEPRDRRVPALPFFDVRHLIGPADRHVIARDLATVLADLHAPDVLRTVSGTLGPLPDPTADAGDARDHGHAAGPIRGTGQARSARLRCVPGDCGADLFTATVAHYQELTGTTVEMDRIMAWHLRTVLGDALWRPKPGSPLPDGRTPTQWVDDLTARFTALGTFG
jgi:hypothetical protein